MKTLMCLSLLAAVALSYGITLASPITVTQRIDRAFDAFRRQQTYDCNVRQVGPSIAYDLCRKDGQ
jgi:hypothetical protein